MVQRFRNAWQAYPGQFWLLITGLLISTIGTSMIWPFLTIYASETLGRPLTAVGGLISINGLISLSASFIAGPITDRAGRKWIMALSLIGNGLTYLAP
jgi:MFS family permease